MATLNDLTQKLSLQKDDGPITAVRLVKGYDNSYALNAAGHITALSLGNSKIKKLVLGAEAEALEYLYLSGSKSLTEVVFEVPLPQLTHLYLNNCAIKQIAFSAGFRALQQIYLQKNGLQRLVFEGDCPALVLMDVSENQLQTLDLSQGFSQLQYLYASKNALEVINFNRSMQKLNTLHLAENRLIDLSPFLSEVETIETLYLKGNQLRAIDQEVWDTNRNCWDTMKGYLTSLNKGKVTREYLHEAKMILIGNGEVGKTSIRLKLLDINAKLPDKEDRTPGLDVVPYTIHNLLPAQTGLPHETSFKFNIWDFGGQGKYREIQQLFCSRKSLYLYVTACDDKPNYKEAYIGYEYWLSMANAYNHDNGQNSPVLYVQNKCDKEKEAINESEIKTKFGNIEDFIKISCADTQQFTVLPKAITESIAKISNDIFSVQYNAEWLGVKQDLNNLKERGVNHISKQRFDEICRERGLNEDEIKAWLVVLDRVGTIIYFGENDKLSNWIVLNPIWVKDAVCKVIDFEFYDDIATLKPAFLPKIWKDYDNEERAKLQALLLAYDFCYEENGSFIVPALFSEEKPTYPTHLADFDCEIKFCYKPFLPAGTLHKFMVKLKSCIYNDLRWKKGVVLHDGVTNTYAEVIERWEEHSIYIRLKGEKHLNLIWNTVRYSFEELNAILKSTKFLKNLEFEIRYNHEGDWNTESQMAKICKLDNKIVFKRLLNSGTPRGLGEPDAPTKKMIDNSKPYEISKASDSVMPKGVVLHSIPNKMQVQNLHRCIVRVAFSKEIVLRDLTALADNIVVKEGIRITDSMEVRVSENRYFEIQAINNLKQIIEEDEVTEWNFFVRPLAIGRFFLSFTISAVMPNGSKEVVLNERVEVGTEMVSNAMECVLTPLETVSSITSPSFTPFNEIKGKIKILFLAATPNSSSPINTGLESRFQDIIRLWAKEGRFEKVQAEQGLDKAGFKGFLITENPHILHYGGHGDKEGIILEKGDLKAETLKSYLKLSTNVQCVILNACNSFEIAKSIAEYVPYVIATQAKINDDTAIAFSRGFYLGIAANRTIEEAFELGLIEIEDEELSGKEVLILVKGTPKT